MRKLRNAPTSDEQPTELVPDPVVAKEFNVTPMTIWRWTGDASMGFPPPIKINGRNYRSRNHLENYKRKLIDAAIEKQRRQQAIASLYYRRSGD